MSKRKNRLLRAEEAAYAESRRPDFIAGALTSGVPADLNPALRLRDAMAEVWSKPPRGRPPRLEILAPSASGMSASGQDPKGLEAKPAGPVTRAARQAPNL